MHVLWPTETGVALFDMDSVSHIERDGVTLIAADYYERISVGEFSDSEAAWTALRMIAQALLTGVRVVDLTEE